MHNLTNLTTARDIIVLTIGVDTDAFYGTMVSASAIVIAVVCAFSIYAVTTANETIREKKREIREIFSSLASEISIERKR